MLPRILPYIKLQIMIKKKSFQNSTSGFDSARKVHQMANSTIPTRHSENYHIDGTKGKLLHLISDRSIDIVKGFLKKSHIIATRWKI